MAEERDDEQFGENEDSNSQQATGQKGQQSEFGQQQGQQSGNLGLHQSMSGQNSGQAIGGNDSETGSGTTMSQGSDFGGQSSSGQAQSSGSGKPSDQGFIGSQGSGSDDLVQDRDATTGASPLDATGGSDFAGLGQGALDREQNTSQSNRDDSGSKGQDDGGSF